MSKYYSKHTHYGYILCDEYEYIMCDDSLIPGPHQALFIVACGANQCPNRF